MLLREAVMWISLRMLNTVGFGQVMIPTSLLRSISSYY